MLNKTIIMGRLTSDPELRRTQNGTPVTTFTVACDRDIKNANGERYTDFFDVVAWLGTAEFIAKHFHRGGGIIVEGRLQSRKYQDKNGDNRYVIEVLAKQAYFTNDGKRYATDPAAADPAPAGFTEVAEEDGELPF